MSGRPRIYQTPEESRAAKREAMRAWYARKRADGRCKRCDGPALRFAHCKACRDLIMAKWRAGRDTIPTR
jgi:hypothetical protein